MISQSISEISQSIDFKIEHINDYKVKVYFFNTHPFIIAAIRSSLITKTPSIRFEDMLIGDENNVKTTNDYNINLTLGFVHIAVNADLFVYEDEIKNNHPFSGISGYEMKQPPWLPRYEAENIVRQQTGAAVTPRLNKPKLRHHFTELPSDPDPTSCLVYDLNVKCYFDEENKKLMHYQVFGKDLNWIPIGNQLEILTRENSLPYINPDIVIADLSEGECIQRRLYAVKGTGFEFNKWNGVKSHFSPVKISAAEPNTNSYELFIESLDEKTNPKYYFKKALESLKETFKQIHNDFSVGYMQNY